MRRGVKHFAESGKGIVCRERDPASAPFVPSTHEHFPGILSAPWHLERPFLCTVALRIVLTCRVRFVVAIGKTASSGPSEEMQSPIAQPGQRSACRFDRGVEAQIARWWQDLVHEHKRVAESKERPSN